MRVQARPQADKTAAPAELERLAVQRGRHATGGAGQQDALQCLAGADPVGGLVGAGRQDAHGPGGPARQGAQRRHSPAAAVGEAGGGEVREGPLGPRRVGVRGDSVVPDAAGRARPHDALAGAGAVQRKCLLGLLYHLGERGPDALIGDDLQHRAVPGGAFNEFREELRCRRQRVEPAPVRPPLTDLGGQPALERGRCRAVLPGQPGDEQRLGRLGQDLRTGNPAGRAKREAGGEQRRPAAE